MDASLRQMIGYNYLVLSSVDKRAWQTCELASSSSCAGHGESGVQKAIMIVEIYIQKSLSDLYSNTEEIFQLHLDSITQQIKCIQF